MNWLKSYKSSNLLLWKLFLKKSLPATPQLPTYPITVKVSHQYLLTLRIQCSTLSILKNLFLCRKRFATTKKPKSLIINLQSLQFILICVQNMNFNQTVSYDNMVYFIDDENIVTYVDFDCGTTFYPETPTKVRQINRERKYISRSCEKPKCIPSNDQHNCSFDKQHTFNIFLHTYNLWDVVPSALMSLNQSNDR